MRRARSHSQKLLQHLPKDQVLVAAILAVATLSTGMLLYFLSDILVPLLFAVFLTYLLLPVVDVLHRPQGMLVWLRLLNATVSTPLPQSPRHRAPSSGSSNGGSEAFAVNFYQQCAPGNPLRRGPTSSVWTSPEEGTPLIPQGTAQQQRCSLASVGCPRAIAVLIVVILVIGIVCGMGFGLFQSALTLEGNEEKYVQGAEALSGALSDRLQRFLAALHIDLGSVLPAKVTDFIRSATLTVVGLIPFYIEKALVTMIFLIYLLYSPPRREGFWVTVDQHVRRYIQLKSAISLGVACSVGLVLWATAIDCALIFALITFVANFIPNVGSTFATVLPLPLIVLNPSLTMFARLVAFLLPWAIHFTIGNIVEPLVFGKALYLHPVIVVLSLGVFARIWGIAGMILAVPLVALARIVLLDSNHPLAPKTVRILEGRIFEAHAE